MSKPDIFISRKSGHFYFLFTAMLKNLQNIFFSIKINSVKTEVKNCNVGIFGFGNMGQAIFSILTKNKGIGEIFIHSAYLQKLKGATCVGSIEELINNCDIIFLCTKPQDFYKLSTDIKAIRKNSTILISIMAGVTIGNIQKIIPLKKIVRTMPNLALQIQGSVTGWHTAKKSLSKKELEQIIALLDSFGLSVFTKTENMLNAITAISGSGPAYVFLFIDSLVRAAESLGFPEEDARKIVFQTIQGAMDYARKMDDVPLEDLIAKVTSKKGTTEAALKKINVPDFYKKWQQATLKAYERARELSTHDIK